MDRARKEEVVAALGRIFQDATLVVVTHQRGLKVSESTELRRQMREAGSVYVVTKNRLAKLALAGSRFEGLADIFMGPTAIACSADPVAAARVVARYAKGNEKLTIVGGALGEKVLDVAGVQQLAQLPSLDELRAQLIGVINAPATKIAGVLQAPGGQLARVLGAYGEKQQAA
ncbi:MAG: 50S ribosomal protein L10 [Alphaproteobacteria bacterium]